MVDLSPIKKTLMLKAPPERAFDHYTKQIHVWWPLSTHSLSQSSAVHVTFETEEGGRIFETDHNGREREWGRVKLFDRPNRLIYSWVLEAPEKETEVEISFESDDAGGSVMTLVHRGWERRPDGGEARGQYVPGWESVLALYWQSLSTS